MRESFKETNSGVYSKGLNFWMHNSDVYLKGSNSQIHSTNFKPL